MFDGATQLVRSVGLVLEDAERTAALEIRPADRTSDESMVGLLRDACDRPGQGRDEAMEADSDGAEL